MYNFIARTAGLSAAALIALALTAPANAADEVGTVGEVKVGAYGTLPERGRNTLDPEETVFRDELVETVPEGGLTVIFLDGTSFHLGSNSSAKLDKFVYDPDANEGKGLVELGTGVFRFITASDTNDDGITFATANSVIGVRGTDFIVDTKPGQDRIGTVSGLVEVNLSGSWRSAEVGPGFYATVNRDRKSVEVRSAPVRSADMACWLAGQKDHVCTVVGRDPGGSRQAKQDRWDRDTPSAPDPAPSREPASQGTSVGLGPR